VEKFVTVAVAARLMLFGALARWDWPRWPEAPGRARAEVRARRTRRGRAVPGGGGPADADRTEVVRENSRFACDCTPG